MAKKVFTDYMAANEKAFEGFTAAEVMTGINAEGNGMMIGFERKIDDVVLGIDVIYNPICSEDETPFMVSNEFVKRIE